MKDMIMRFVNEGTKITISDNRIEMVISKDNIVKVDANKIVVKNNNMMQFMKWNDVEYFKF